MEKDRDKLASGFTTVLGNREPASYKSIVCKTLCHRYYNSVHASYIRAIRVYQCQRYPIGNRIARTSLKLEETKKIVHIPLGFDTPTNNISAFSSSFLRG